VSKGTHGGTIFFEVNVPRTLLDPDVQARRPATTISLSRVGVTGVEKVISIRANGAEQLFYAELECFVDLAADRKGAHMSRFEEVVNEAIARRLRGCAPRCWPAHRRAGPRAPGRAPGDDRRYPRRPPRDRPPSGRSTPSSGRRRFREGHPHLTGVAQGMTDPLRGLVEALARNL
jgi:GTP cyclohydrolase I/GTP cyclohydrolase-4